MWGAVVVSTSNIEVDRCMKPRKEASTFNLGCSAMAGDEAEIEKPVLDRRRAGLATSAGTEGPGAFASLCGQAVDQLDVSETGREMLRAYALFAAMEDATEVLAPSQSNQASSPRQE